MQTSDKILVAGHTGMVGSAIVRCLRQSGYNNLLLPTHNQLNLCNQTAVNHYFAQHKPKFVFLAAAKVGGIIANNTYPADFIYQNLCIQTHVIHAAYRVGVTKLLFLGSSCIYPKNAAQPIKESELLSGYLEPTNQAYAIAKIAGLEMCHAYNRQYGCNFIAAMPANLYGPNDNYHPQNSHVLPALLHRFHQAATQKLPNVVVWGTGKPRREFLHVNDLANACLFLMQHYNQPQPINIGTGTDVSIAELAQLIQEITGYTGTLTFDTTKPDGTLRKCLDVGKINALGWKHHINLPDGISELYKQTFVQN